MFPGSRLHSGVHRKLIIHFIILAFQVFLVSGQLPSFSGCLPVLQFLEDTPIGSKLFSINATVNSGNFPSRNLTFYTAGGTSTLVNLTQAQYLLSNIWTTDVILIASLDRETLPQIRLTFIASDSVQNSTLDCGIFVKDVNDNHPTFQNLPYSAEVPENTTVGTVLLTGLHATDSDDGTGGTVKVTCLRTPSVVQCDDDVISTSGGYVAAVNVTLSEQLDYESQRIYTWELIAQDGGGLNSSALVTVTVLDVQDTPPYFLVETYRAAIMENQPVGTFVVKVSAQDGDQTLPNDITYSIVSGRSDYFSIQETGEIVTLVVLDRDNATMIDSYGTFELTVRATEKTLLPQYGNFTSDVMVFILVEDANDEWPVFDKAIYTAAVMENTPLNSIIYFDGDGFISVSDADQGRNSHFNLTVERDGSPWPTLQATPTEVYWEALVLLKVNEMDAFYNNTGTQIRLQLVAREISTTERRSSTVEIVIAVEKVPEPPTSPAPADSSSITAPDIVVFIIGFLVIFNIVASTLIICFMRKRSASSTQGGSRYYVNGGENSGNCTGSTVSLRSESIILKGEDNNRRHARPRSAVKTESKSELSSSKIAKEHKEPVALSYDTVESNDRAPVNVNAKPPAKSSKDGSLITTHALITETASSADVPDFSMATRNVTGPKNSALEFVNSSASSLAKASSYQTAAPHQVPTASSNAISSALEPLTRFSTTGTVSTTVVTAPSNLFIASHNPADDVNSGSGNGSAAKPSNAGEKSGSASEILY